MILNHDTRSWEREENEALAIAAVLGLFIAPLVAVAAGIFTGEYEVYVGSFVFLFAFITVSWGVYKLQVRRRFTVSKVFLVRQHIAHEVIERVLQEKGIPYEKVNGRYQLEGNGLSIQIDEGYIGPSPFWRIVNKQPLFTTEEPGSRIKIHPLTTENSAMIVALRQKIDEAFAPRGLP